MKQNNQHTNTPIMLDSKNPSNQNNLLQYEAHIKLMYKYAIVSFMFIVMACFLVGCHTQEIYPDSKEFTIICNEAEKKRELKEVLYGERLGPNMKQFFDFYKLYDKNQDRKDCIFGKDRKESNIYRTITYANKERINKIKKDIRELKSKKEDLITLTDSDGFTTKIDRKSSIKDLEIELFLLENYYGEIIEQRINETSLITKEEFFIKNKKTKAIAFKIIHYKLYADRGMSISINKDLAKVEYKAKQGDDVDAFLEMEQEPVDDCSGDFTIVKELNETK